MPRAARERLNGEAMANFYTGLTSNGRRRWQLWMGLDDFDAAEEVRKRHGFRQLAEAVRFCIQQQAGREKRGESK
jgi:hypothetical protein